MPIILSQTYEIVTEESAESGMAAESGFDWEDCPHTFRETVDLIKDGGFIYPSCSHGVPGWLSTEAEMDMYTGEYETKAFILAKTSAASAIGKRLAVPLESSNKEYHNENHTKRIPFHAWARIRRMHHHDE